ncbi:laminin subunit alpha-5-like, partial [Poeciliopsis prolifica]|uniref:laminin subunit alpha-5-like n=1 Tax=Poeciliopsis prolifica TaxID=188132 RepID=UPI0024142943
PQTAVKLQVYVSEADVYLTRFILRYVNSEGVTSSGKITAYQANRRGSEQSKQIVFAPSVQPTFVNVPQNSFVEPFVLNPGSWTVVIEAEGILLDFLVLLPSAYYEAPILQIRVTEPCTYSSENSQNCLLYKFLSLDSFPSISGNDASCRHDNHLPRPCPTERVTPRHPDMAVCSGLDISIELRGRLASPGDYALVVEYSSEEELPQTLSVAVNSPGAPTQRHLVTLLHCKFSFLCRVVAVDDQNRVAVFSLATDADVQLSSERASFFLHKVYLVPKDVFTMEFVEPGLHCIGTHGQFSPDSSSCIPSRFQTPSDSVVLKEGQSSSTEDAPVQASAAPPLSPSQRDEPVWMGDVRPPFGADNSVHMRLDSLQNAAVYSTRLQALGRYVFILHFHQPLHPTYPVQVYINGGVIWQGLRSLVVPERSYSSSYLNEEPLDKSYDFISNCGQNSFSVSPAAASPFCLSSAVSLSAFFNNGAIPCACHEAGAESDACEPFGGQCRCRPNVIGRDCSMCATGFWGFPNCRPCNCGPRLCEPCEPQTFGCHPVVGCEICNCSRPGIVSLDVSCDTDSGQCRCRNNIVGRQCDRCAPGFYGYPNCRPCDCNEAGTEEEVCDSFTGRCLCKIMDMNGWVLLGADRQEVPVTVYPDQDLMEADLRDVPDVYQDLHWHAPKAYLGDKVSSYGGSLRYRIHTQTMRGDALPLPAEASRPDIILKGSFRHARTGNPVSREELMMVLVNLESLQIRALHSQSAHSVSLRGAVLEGAADLTSGRHANNVEICMCPANYRGDSCQKCAPGYYRDTIGLFLGKCVPCNCNGHSDQCLDGSGVCLSCQHNTVGDHCESCRGGFLSNNSLDGQAVSCSSCPCPLRAPSNNFAEGCVQRSDRMQCLCMHGYAGPNCERCAPGFLRQPMVLGSRCQPCHCNGNTDPNMLFTDCHPLTGECLSCMHNTAGPHCDLCAPGYHGDAIHAKNCTILAKRQQQIQHKKKMTPFVMQDATVLHVEPNPATHRRVSVAVSPGSPDRSVTAAQDGSFGFNSCSGCRQCECEASAALVQPCNPQSGQCACQPGVNGPNCRQCAPLGLRTGRLQEWWCDCNGGRCDPRTGECHCPDGMTGRQCDACLERYSVPVEDRHGMHCEVCDSCVIVLLEDLERLDGDFSSVSQQLRNLNASSMAWGQLVSLNTSMQDVARAIESYNNTLDESRIRADMLDMDIATITADIDDLHRKSGVMTGRVGLLDDSTSQTHNRAEDLLRFINNISLDINATLHMANQSQNETEDDQDVEGQEAKIREVQAILREMRFRSCVGQKKLADKEKNETEKLLDRVIKELENRQQENVNLTKAIRDRLQRFTSEMINLRDALNEAVNNTARAAELNSINEKTLEENNRKIEDLLMKQKEVNDTLEMAVADVTQVNTVVQMLQESKEEYEHLAAQLDGAWSPLAKKVQTFAATNDLIPLVEKAEKHAELLNALAMNLTSLIAETKKDPSVDLTKAYNNVVNNITAAEHAAKMAEKAANDTLENIKNQDLGKSASALKNHSIELHGEVQQMNDELNNTLKGELEEAQKRLNLAKAKHDQAMKDLAEIQKSLNSTSNATQEINEAKTVAGKANITATDVNNMLLPIKKQLDQWQQAYGDTNTTSDDINKALINASETVQKLEENIPTLLKKLDDLQNYSVQMPNISENINRIRQLIQEARSTVNKVSVSMKFNGKSAVQVRTPSDLADLAAYTSMKLFISPKPLTKRKRSTSDSKPQFVFFLGNNNSDKEFLGLVLEGKILSWYFNVGEETIKVTSSHDARTDGTFNGVLLDRMLQYGQMSMSYFLNDDEKIFKAEGEGKGDMGLLNLQANNTVFYVGGPPDSFQLPDPFNNSTGFEGCIQLESLNQKVVSLYNFEKAFNLNTKTEKPCSRSSVDDGEYFDGTGFAEINFTSSYLRPVMAIDQDIKLLSHKGILVFLKKEEKFLCLAVLQGQLRLYYDFNGTLIDHPPDTNDFNLLKISDGELRLFKQLFSARNSVKACIKNLKNTGNHVNMKTVKASGVSSGCNSNLLDGICQVSLQKGNVVLRVNNSEVKTQKTYNDNNSHNVAFYISRSGFYLLMDDVVERNAVKMNTKPPAYTGPEDVTFLGGLPQQTADNLTGCISNVIIKRGTKRSRRDLAAAVPGSPARGSCRTRATHFSGSAHSYQKFDPVVRSISHLSLEVKINSSDGCVLYAAGRQHGGAAMLLSVLKGHLILSVESARNNVKVRSLNKYDDERWHPVFIKHEGNKISLTVDGISSRAKKIAGAGKIRISGPLFIGGVPASVKPKRFDGFIGCVKDLKLNAFPAGSPSFSQGAVPCFQNPLQPGVYFSKQGGHLKIDDSLVLGRDLDIQLEVRPASDSGLLLYAGTSSDQYLSLFLSQGEVTVLVISGKGEFSTSLMPEEPLCNRRWHTIKVEKRNNVLKLVVDVTAKQSAGPNRTVLQGPKLPCTLEEHRVSGVTTASHPTGFPVFHGCFRHVGINRRPVPLSEPLSVHGAVGTRGCPHM